MRDADRTVGDFGRLARQGFFSLRRAAQMNSRWRWRLSMRFAMTRHALEPNIDLENPF